MNRPIALIAALALMAALPAFAQDATAPAPAVAAPAPQHARDDAKVDRFCLRETGTRIRARASKTGERGCASVAAGRVYSQDDLRSTGQVDIADALRMLDPSIR